MRRPRTRYRVACLATLAWLLGACASSGSGPDTPTPSLTSSRFKHATPPDTHSHAPAPNDGRWWRVFGDPTLDALIGRATQDNPGLQIAQARVTQAQALLQGARAQRTPQIGVGAGAMRQSGPVIHAGADDGTQLTASLRLSWDPDVSGRLAALASAAEHDAIARSAQAAAVRLIVQAEVAHTYFAWRSVRTEADLLEATAQTQREGLSIIQRRERAGYAAELDVVRAQAELSELEAERSLLEQQRDALENALAALVGVTPADLTLSTAPGEPTLPNIPAGLPSALLARRPDVAAAQHTLLAAQARQGVAQRAWLPELSLTAAGGFASSALSDLFRVSMRAWGLGALLALPVFDGGRREATLLQTRGEVDAMLATHRQQVLTAFREVEDQLSALRHLQAQAQAREAAAGSAARAVSLADSRYRAGLASLLDGLDARRTELRNRRAALRVGAARLQATVGLIRALGGGWDAAPALALARPGEP